MKSYSSSRSILKFFLFSLAVALGIVTLGNPVKEGEGEPIVRKGLDLVLAVDVSKSMLAADVLPNRLSGAKALLKRLLHDRPNDRIGLIAFAGHAYAQMPLTYDHSNAELLINALDPQLFTAQGTSIGDALKMGKTILNKSPGHYKVMVLLTDGETFDKASGVDDPPSLSRDLANAGIVVIPVGFGSAAGTILVDPLTKTVKKDAQGAPVITKLDEELLQAIATQTKGRYIHFEDLNQTKKTLLDQLASVKELSLVDKSLLNYQSLYLWLALPMLILLVIEFFLPDRKKVNA